MRRAFSTRERVTVQWRVVAHLLRRAFSNEFRYKQKQARNRRQSTQHRASECAKRSLRLSFSKIPSNSAAIKTKISPIEAKERKLWSFEEGQSTSSLESRQAWTRPELQSLGFAVSKCWFQWECPTSAFFLPLPMRADLDNFFVDLKPNMANFFPTV